MKKTLIAIPFLMMSLGATAATHSLSKSSDDMTAEQYKEKALKSEDFKTGFKIGYISGMTAGIISVIANKQFGICPDPEVTDGEMFTSVMKYIKAHPEKEDMDPVLLVGFALKDKWSC